MALLTEVWSDYPQSVQDPFQPIIPTSEESPKKHQVDTQIDSKAGIHKKDKRKKKIIEYYSESEGDYSDNSEVDNTPEVNHTRKNFKNKKDIANNIYRKNHIPIEHFAYHPEDAKLIPSHVRARNINEYNINADLDLDFSKSRILLLGCGIFLLYAFDALRK